MTTCLSLKTELEKIIKAHVGRDSAIGASVLAEMFGYDDDRIIRQTIEELVDDKFPVCSVMQEPAGYFFPANEEESRVHTKHLQKRAVKTFVRRRHIIRATHDYYENLRRQAEVAVHQERLL